MKWMNPLGSMQQKLAMFYVGFWKNCKKGTHFFKTFLDGSLTNCL